jgi:hypothetical protein
MALRRISTGVGGYPVTFENRTHKKGADLLFGHRDWKEPSEFYMHCNSKWGFFLVVSLKNTARRAADSLIRKTRIFKKCSA